MAMNKRVAVLLIVVILAASAGAGGWFLWHNKIGISRKAPVKQLYTCPEHPFIISEKPGNCPICGMELVPKESLAATAGAGNALSHEMHLGHVMVSTDQRIMANVATAAAKEQTLTKEINAVGLVQYDQSRQVKVTAWIAGRLDKLNVDKVGDLVFKNKPVAEIYSPDLVSSEEEYLLAVKSRDQLKFSPIAAISNNGDGLVKSARDRLKLFGVRDQQLEDLEKAGEPNIDIHIYTPLSGIVIDKLVQLGQYVKTGDVLFDVADLSYVWVEMEVYEDEIGLIHLGQGVDILSQSYPGKTLSGRVIYIYPFLDPKTRTTKVRAAIPNPRLELKPDMFVNGIFRIPLHRTIVVPVTAVMDTGERKVVWIESSPGMFEPRYVQTGVRDGDNIQILSGLNVGDMVAISGGYMIDSESQLKGGWQQGGQEVNVPQPATKKP